MTEETLVAGCDPRQLGIAASRPCSAVSKLREEQDVALE